MSWSVPRPRGPGAIRLSRRRPSGGTGSAAILRFPRPCREQAQVRWIDRRGLDAYQHLVVGGGRNGDVVQSQLEPREVTNECSDRALPGKPAVMGGASFPVVCARVATTA